MKKFLVLATVSLFTMAFLNKMDLETIKQNNVKINDLTIAALDARAVIKVNKKYKENNYKVAHDPFDEFVLCKYWVKNSQIKDYGNKCDKYKKFF